MVNNLKSVLKVVKNFKETLIIIAILIIISYFLPIETPTGFVVNEDSKLTQEVQEKAYYEEEVDVIVKLKDVEGKTFLYDNREADIKEVKEEIKYELEEKIDLEELDSFAGRITKEGLKKLEIHPNVEVVQIDHTFTVTLQDSLPLINATKLHSNNITGKNIGICILDTGINYAHSALIDNYVTGYDYVNDDSDPLDDHGHGTHVSGIIQGVAPNIKIIHIKVLNSQGSGSESDIIAGINWCINNKTLYNISVISMSLGAGLYTSYCDNNFPTLASAIDNAITNSISVTASTGNDGSTTSISSPACIKNTTAVSATDKNDNMASYANINNLVDLLAPGSNINSTSMDGSYSTLSGTSMSAPHVSSSIALIQEFNFEINNNYSTPKDVEDLLKNNGINISNYKRIDVYNALKKLDHIKPNIVLYSPENKAYGENNISLNYAAYDRFLERVYYNINGTNVSINGNTTIYVEGGNKTLTIFAEDGNNNINSSSVTFLVGLPSITLHTPKDNYNDIDGYVEFNCSVSSINNVINLSLYHNANGIFSLNQSVNSNGSFGNALFKSNFTLNTTITWNCLGYDSTNNYDWGDNRTLRININNAPEIESYMPNFSNISMLESEMQQFNITYNDSDKDPVNISWYLDNILVSNNNNYSIGPNYTIAGNHNILVTIKDEYNSNDSFTWNVNIINVEYCGDNFKNSTEQCDGTDLGGSTCSNYGYNSGTLTCGNCVISYSSCTNSTSSGGGDSGGNEKNTKETSEKLVAFSDLNKEEFVDEEISEKTIEEIIEVESPQEEEKTEEIIEPVEEKTYAWIGGITATILGGIIIFLLLRKEWKIIREK